MENLQKYTVEHKEDVWRIPEETRVLTVNCRLDKHLAKEIIKKCRELESVEFSPHAYKLASDDAIEYFEPRVFVRIVGKESGYKIDKETFKKIRELWTRGDHNLHNLSKKFNISKEAVYHIVHEKAPEHVKEEKYKHGG